MPLIENDMNIDDDKQRAAEAAVAEVRDGMLLGLGTGSTAAHAIAAIGAKVAAGLRIEAVATSRASERLARDLGIPLVDFSAIGAVDLAIDGVDEIDGGLRAIKGAGGAMLREKIVARAARRMVAIADGSKRVDRLGRASVPVEVLPLARSFATAQLERLGARPELRMAGDDPYLTDQDNIVIDCHFADLADAAPLAVDLATIPGILGHGLFLREIDAAYIVDAGRVTRLERD